MKKQVDKGISRKAGEGQTFSVSCYQGVDPANYLGEKSLAEVFKIIRTIPIKTEKRIRELKSKLGGLKPGAAEYKKTRAEYEALKERLFSFTPSGICRNGRTNKDLTDYNGLVVADFDELLDEAERERVKRIVEKSPNTRAAWGSISGLGVKALVQGQPAKELHADNFRAVAKHMKKLTGYEIDPKCRNIARLCFGAHDPKIFANEKAVPIKIVQRPEPKKREPAPLAYDKLARFKTAIEAHGLVGKIEWTTLQGKPVGLCRCPDPDRQHPKATIHLTGVPNLYCHHEKCKSEHIPLYNEWLQTAWNQLQGWVHIVGTKCWLNVETHLELDKEKFNNRFADEFNGLPSRVVLRNPKFPKYDHQIYLPSNPHQTFEEKGQSYFNLWRPQTDIESVRGDVTPLDNHFEFLFPDKKRRNVLKEWLAWNVQHPGEKLLWVPVIYGGQEVGKSLIGFIMERMLGSDNVVRPTNDMLHETFTDWAKDRCLAVIEELMTIGRQEQMNKLKAIITEATIMIREMYKTAYAQPNTVNLIAFTNYEDAVKLDRDDRRYCILAAPKEPHPSGAAYYRPLWEWVKELGNQSAMLHWFQNYDLSHFDRYARAPMTEEKRAVIADSRPPIESWMNECIESGAEPFVDDLVWINDLREQVPPHLSRYNTDQTLKAALRACGAASPHGAGAPKHSGSVQSPSLNLLRVSAKPVGVGGCVSTVNSCGRTVFIADAHRDGEKRFVVPANEKRTAFQELELAIVRVSPRLLNAAPLRPRSTLL
jgi:hypothetical protein